MSVESEKEVSGNVNNLGFLIKAAYQFGIPAVIAVALIWVLATRIDSNIVKLTENMSLHAQDSAFTVKELEKVKLILQRICINTSSERGEREACFQ